MNGEKKDRPPKPWERQPGEQAAAFKAFAAYRDSGINGKRRSLQKTAQSLIKSDGKPYSSGTLRVWSQRNNWRARVDAFDEEQDREIREELRRGTAAMLKKHIGVADAMIKQAYEAVKKIDPEAMSPKDIAVMVDVAAKLERISRGEATERTEGRQEIAGEVQAEAVLKVEAQDLSALTDEELEQLGQLVGKLADG